MSPQFVVIVNVFAGVLVAAAGCFTVAGVWPFAVLLAHPATDVGRVAAWAGVSETKARSELVSSAIAVVLFILRFLFPFNRARRLTCYINDNAVYLTDFIGNAR